MVHISGLNLQKNLGLFKGTCQNFFMDLWLLGQSQWNQNSALNMQNFDLILALKDES